VIEKRTLPPPTPVAVYELTEAGQALAPVIGELRAWGERYGPAPRPGDAVRPAWIVQGAASKGKRLGSGRVIELHVGNEVFELTAGKTEVTVKSRPASAPDAVIKIEPRVLISLASGRIEPARAREQIEVEGDRDAAADVVTMLAGSAR
jgi:hypothetical protein